MNKIRAFREFTGKTQELFAEWVGVSRSALSNWELDLRTPGFDDAEKIINKAIEVNYPLIYSDVLSRKHHHKIRKPKGDLCHQMQ